MNTFKGSHFEIGRRYGEAFRSIIQQNIDILVKRIGYPALPLDDSDFQKWVSTQKDIIGSNWPWLVEEMRGVADGAGLELNDILFLNLRVWQYDLYSAKTPCSCSSMVIELADGTVANVGALDDCRDYYCGMVKVIPKQGYGFITFPIAGTTWGNRGINSTGLCIGESSQILKGLKQLSGYICADIAVRVILQTCKTVDEVRKFCKKYPFTLNLVCSDKNGDVFTAHCTSAGLFETANASPWVITNHVTDDLIKLKLYERGGYEFRESNTTHLRRGRLLDYAEKFNARCEAEDVRKYIADRMAGDSSSICPPGNIVLTYANPQAEPGVIWIAEPQVTDNEEWVKYECF